MALNFRVHQKEMIFKSQQQRKAKKAKLSGSESKEEETASMIDFPEPPVIDLKPEDFPDTNFSQWKKPVVLNRLTITFYNNDFLPFVSNSSTVKKYDLLSVCAESTLAMQNLNKSAFRADIVTFDPERVKDVHWSRKLYMECVEKGMHFELNYSPCIRDHTARRRIIAQAHNYHAVGKSKAIIISSEALNPIEMRGPHDVANLGYIFGLNEQQGKAAVKHNPVKATKLAAGRKVGPYRALIRKADDLPEHEKWKIPQEESSSDSIESSEDEEGDSESDTDQEHKEIEGAAVEMEAN